MSWINANDELYTGEVSDVVLEVISGAPTAPPAPYVLIVRGVAANGALADAAATGVELAETATRLTGNLTSFLMPGRREVWGGRLDHPAARSGCTRSKPGDAASERRMAQAGGSIWSRVPTRCHHLAHASPQRPRVARAGSPAPSLLRVHRPTSTGTDVTTVFGRYSRRAFSASADWLCSHCCFQA